MNRPANHHALALLVALLALPVAARAQEPQDPFAGRWLAGDSSREVTVGREGLYSARLAFPRQAPLHLEGRGGDRVLRLEARRARTRGIVGALNDDAPEEGEELLRVTLERTGAEEPELYVTFERDGRQVAMEMWRRPARPGLRILEVITPDMDGKGGFDPIAGPLRLRVAVDGVPQRVGLDVIQQDDGPRWTFYRGKGLGECIRQDDTGEPLAVGEHLLAWDGRDATGDRRLALAGAYTLVLRSSAPEVEPVRRPVTVPAPYLVTFSPDFSQSSMGDWPGSRAQLAAFAGEQAGYRPQAIASPWLSAGAFLKEASRAAQVAVTTHGNVALFSLGNGVLTSGDLATSQQPPSLRDVRLAVIYACLTGAVNQNNLDDLPLELGAAGVDLVIAFEDSVMTGQSEAFYRELAVELVRTGWPIQSAAWAAAEEADRAFWGHPVRKAATFVWFEEKRLRPAMRVHRAAGIDHDEETAVPARYGCATNSFSPPPVVPLHACQGPCAAPAQGARAPRSGTR